MRQATPKAQRRLYNGQASPIDRDGRFVVREDDLDAFSIFEFSRRHGFSTSHYFQMVKQGIGPRTMKVGQRVLVSREAAADWRLEREAASKLKATSALSAIVTA